MKNGAKSPWPTAQLGDLLIRLANGTTATQSKEPPGIPVSRIETISNATINYEKVHYVRDLEEKKKELFLVQQGDILFSHINSDLHLGKSALATGCAELLHGMNLLLMRPSKELDSKFLNYFLTQLRFSGFFISIAQHAVNQSSLNQQKLKAIEVPLPPLPEQRRIVARIEELFSHLDAGVAALRHAKAQLQRYRQSVLAAAVTGELTKEWRERHPDVEPAEELMKRVLKQRREQWNGRGKYTEPSSIGETPRVSLPECWKWCSLDTVSAAIGGFAFKSKEYTDSGYQIVKMGNVRMHRFELENNPSFIESVSPDIVEKYLLRRDDLVITLTGTRKKRDYGFVARVREEQNLLLNQRIALIRPCSLIDPGFLLLALSAEYFRDQFFAGETGNVGQGNVSMKAVTGSAFALPPLAEQHQIVAEVEARTTIIDHLEAELDRQITRSNRLRQSTLAAAFSAKLTRANA